MKHGTVRSVWRTITTAACLILVLGIGGAAYLRMQNQLDFLPVLSGSMEPTINTGDLVMAKPLPVGTVNVGDIVVFQPPEQFATDGHKPIVHRVVEIDDRNGQPIVRTRGDANSVSDPWELNLRSSQFWKVATTIPHGGVTALFIKDHWRELGGALIGLLVTTYAAGSLLRGRRPSETSEDSSKPHEQTRPDLPVVCTCSRPAGTTPIQ